jgi:predicted ATP-dependent protease
VGGIKEKVLAARRMGIRTVLLPARNDKDVKELPANVKRGMNFVFADHMDQVLEVALAKRTRARRRLQLPLSAKRAEGPPRHLSLGPAAGGGAWRA